MPKLLNTNIFPTSSFSVYFSFFILILTSYFKSLKSKKNNVSIHNWQTETSQGVEFTEISCGRAELGWSGCEGMTSRCKGFRATVSCANDGRKLGSLGGKIQKEE